MSLLGSETVAVYPMTATTANGKVSLGPTPDADYTLTATLLPVGTHELERLPEGARTSARFTMLVEGNPSLRVQAPADRVLCSRGACVVIGEVDYTNHTTGLPHRAYILAKAADDEF